ncbi:hypothetical protein TNIN_378221 [Trichonephila inaurata madagascariensis]|uniref:Peroxisomal multifunctional enzyme type 2 n=1 Tax=Trichonephila inaurata madagascariensis TaxID=2747483 RepID=A0A8X6XVN5_9ARAC|nr:hypothetical protein TNIN_378221 [Trichonephila inaurata madagascariensis]
MGLQSGPLKFSGRVAVVTGAGGGLGRQYALLLAGRGAAVVVNDLGGTPSGEGKSSSAADAVVKEIKDMGGKAVADYNSVEEGEKIVKTAIDNFGRIDILINNAGILRDRAFTNISVEDWDLVHRVHLRGSFMITKAAWPYFRKQKYGRVIMTASGAGIYGNFGQTNYSAAKLGVLGLSNTLAIEGKKYNIHCNTIVPIAASRLTQDILPPDIFDLLKPSLVSPVVAWLCHESCEDTGGIFEAAGGWIGKYQWQRSSGRAFIPPHTLTVEAVRDNWAAITDMSDSSTPSSLQEQTMCLVESLSGDSLPKSKPAKGVPAADPDVFYYDHDKAILYALAVGMSTQEQSALDFLYENSDNFKILPTFGTIAGMNSLFGSNALREQIEKLNGDPTRLLHGEQYLELYEPFRPSGALTSKCNLLDVLDKGSGAVVIIAEDTFNEDNKLVMRTEWTIFLVGAGNFGGKRSTEKGKKVQPPPNRKPDAVIEERTSIDQAALYRLCGDKNPIHIDPSFAAVGGFSQPILHGLCSLGYATRHVLKQFANYDVNLFKAIMARFASPILPGHTLRTEMWKENNRIHFESMCVETGKKVISGAYIDLIGSPKVSNGPVNSNSGPALKSKFIFKTMADQLAEMPEIVPKVQAVFDYWEIRSTKGFYVRQIEAKRQYYADSEIEAIISCKIKNTSAKPQQNEVKSDLQCDKIFEKLGEKLKKNPDLASSIRTIYQWNILKNGKHVSTWTLDLKNDTGSVYKGTPKHDKPDCTFILEDDLFTKIMDGTADPQRAFMSGKLKITGNVLASQKLQAIWENPDEEPEEKMSFAPALEELPVTMKSDFVFEIFAERLSEVPELAQKMKVVYHWMVLQSGKKTSDWTVDLKSGAGSIYRGSPKSGKADVTMTMEDEDIILMMLGKLNPQRAFMTGRLKIKGNIMLTQKLNQLWQEILKSGRAVELPILSAILADKPFDPTLRSETCFVEMGKRVSRQPDLVMKLNTVFEWNITKNGKKRTQWILDLKTEKGMLYDDFADWILFKITADQVLSSNSTKVEGDRSLAAKLLDHLKISAKL